MVDMNDSLSSALDLIKRFADNWMQVSDAINCDELAALVDALDRLKKDAEQTLSNKKATQAIMESDWQPTLTGSANQGIRRSRRIASAGSLFVTEQDTESESSNQDNISSTVLPEASPNEHTTMNAAPGIVFDDRASLPANEAPIEELYGTEISRERQPIEQEPPSSTLHTTRPVVDGQDERTEVEPVQHLDGASNAQAHQAPGTDTQHQATEDLDYIGRQRGPSPQFFNEAFEDQHSIDQDPTESCGNGAQYQAAEEYYIGNQPASESPHQDTAISPIDDSRDVVMYDFPAQPHFFDHAMEDYWSSLRESPTDVEEATAFPNEQYSIDQDHTESCGNGSQYQAAEDPDDIGNQPGPKSPHQEAAIPPVDEFDFGDFVMHDSPSPSHLFGAASGSRHRESQIDTDHMESFSDDPIVQGYVDLACRSSFRLPHELVEDAEHLDARELLLPLVEESPLTSRLLHGLIYTLLPGPLRIIEVYTSAFDPEPSPEENPVDDFVAIVHRNGEALPLLVLGVGISKTLFILDSETVDLPSLEISWLIRPEWRTEHIDPRHIEPRMESTLLSVWIAEACFQYRPLRNVPSSRDLRLRFLRELLAPYQRDSVLEKCGIPSTHTVSQHVDTRCKFARPETQVQTDEFSELDLKILVQNLENFEPEALREALLQKPSEIKRERCLRILQCVDEIGSPHILGSLKLACARKDKDQTYRAIEQPLFEKLFHIHIHLDKQEIQSQLLVARERYFKYCYFETYLRAVAALKEEKDNGYKERRRALARKRRTASFKKGISEEMPPTPRTEEIHRVYKNLSPSGKKRRAPDMVKDEISSKVAEAYGGNARRIRRNINRYINQGRVLHRILQGRRSLDPGLLILFPSFGPNSPSLSMAKFGLELQELEEMNLSEPIELRDMDKLNLDEAAWFGKVLQARPELLEPVPKAVLDLISNSLTQDVDLQERDADGFRDRPLHFFT